MERFLHENTQLPLLVKIGLVHAQFETIHPFLDGNGRIGRLLITFFLCQNDILIKPVLYLSYYLKQHRQEYYDLLQSVRDHGKWEDWLKFFLQGIFEVSQEATETARKILLLREKHRERIAANLGRAAGNGHLVLEHLFGNPIISVAEVQELIGASYPAANQLVQRLDELDIVQELTGQKRNRRFGYNDYIGLFHNA